MSNMPDPIETICRIAREAGVSHAAVLENEEIVCSRTFRDICAGNACGMYGKCYMCPPDIGEIDALMRTLRQYGRGVLYQNICAIEDSFDIEGMQEAGSRHAACSQTMQRALEKEQLPPFLHLSAGGCRLCPRCARQDNLPCRYPDRALSSLEAYGVDVYNTARHAGLKYVNGENTVTYFGLILLKECGHA